MDRHDRVLGPAGLAAYILITGVTRRPGRPDRGSGPQSGGARRILDERLARGEISPVDHRRLREVLEGGEGRSPAGSGAGKA